MEIQHLLMKMLEAELFLHLSHRPAEPVVKLTTAAHLLKIKERDKTALIEIEVLEDEVVLQIPIAEIVLIASDGDKDPEDFAKI